MNDVLPSATTQSGYDEQFTATEAVVRAVAAAEGVSPLDLEPLALAIDPDALDAATESMASSPGQSSGTIEFAYCGYEVTVDSNGDVSLTEGEQGK